MVLASGHHTPNNRPIIVKAWTTNFDFTAEVLNTISIWVKFPNLPLNCCSRGALSRISSALGNPLFVDACTTKIERISYARVLIEMNITLVFPKVIIVQDPSGRVFEQRLEYDWVPMYCPTCLMVGHKCKPKETKTPV